MWMRDKSDFALIELARQGRTEAVEELFHRYAEAILNTVYPILGRRGLAEDVVQETFIAVLEYAESFRYQKNVKAWLTKIAVNQALGELRKSRREEQMIMDIASPTAEIRDTPSTDILHYLQKLPPDQRIAVTLKKIEDYSYEECAEMLEVPMGTVQTRVFHGMRKLRELMERDQVSNG